MSEHSGERCSKGRCGRKWGKEQQKPTPRCLPGGLSHDIKCSSQASCTSSCTTMHWGCMTYWPLAAYCEHVCCLTTAHFSAAALTQVYLVPQQILCGWRPVANRNHYFKRVLFEYQREKEFAWHYSTASLCIRFARVLLSLLSELQISIAEWKNHTALIPFPKPEPKKGKQRR